MENEFKSRQIYPNRDEAVYIIEFHLPEEAFVTLSIVSEQGKNIGQIIEKERYGSGRHEIEFEIGRHDGHFCFYRLSMQTAGNEIVDMKKILA